MSEATPLQPDRIIRDQVIASTTLDSHGERTAKETLERLRKKLSPRSRLNRQHDLGAKSPGYIENLRVIPDATHPAEWVLVADVHLESGSLDEAMRGFSYSLTEDITGNHQAGASCIYIPFPHYNDQAFLRELVALDPQLRVGRWIKKALSPDTNALLLVLVGVVLQPLWEDFYRGTIAPRIKSLFKALPRLRAKGMTADLVLLMMGARDETIHVHFTPDYSVEEHSLDFTTIEQGLRAAATEITRRSQDSRTISMISLYYDKAQTRYVISQVRFTDASEEYLLSSL
ncbi:MAG: hypothetical protein ABL998_04610 [Planctomycetota bacterium]